MQVNSIQVEMWGFWFPCIMWKLSDVMFDCVNKEFSLGLNIKYFV